MMQLRIDRSKITSAIAWIAVATAAATAALAPLPASASVLDGGSLVNRIGVRVANGSLSNEGAAGGASTIIGSPDAYGLIFIKPKTAIGVGTDLILSSTMDRIHLWGLRGFIRQYVVGQGVPVESRSELGSFTTRTRLPVYVGVDLTRYTYYFTNPGVEDFKEEGIFFATHAQAGADWFINRTTSLNLELSMGLLSFGAGQEYIRFRTMAVLMGLSFDF